VLHEHMYLHSTDAEVNKADSAGWTPLYWAVYFKHTEIAALLRAAGGGTE